MEETIVRFPITKKPILLNLLYVPHIIFDQRQSNLRLSDLFCMRLILDELIGYQESDQFRLIKRTFLKAIDDFRVAQGSFFSSVSFAFSPVSMGY